MLLNLSLRNFALIERLDVEFGPGLTVVTGETGAGKSITFDALRLLLGERASAEVIRTGAEEASVAAVLAVGEFARPHVNAALERAGIGATETLVLRRTVSRKGPNRVWVNDTVATAGLLAELLEPLVDLLGQHAHLSLTRPGAHRELVDAFGAYPDLLAEMQQAWTAVRDARRQLAALRDAAAARSERLEFLRFQQQELQALGLKLGEFDDLERRLHRLRNAEKLREAWGRAGRALSEGSPSASGLMGDALEALQRAARADEGVQPLVVRLQELVVLVDDLARDVVGMADDLEDASDLNRMEGRHEQLKRAQRKYGLDEAGLVDKVAAVVEEARRLEHYAESLESAERAVSTAERSALTVARALRTRRMDAAARLFEAATGVLARLGMPRTRLALEPDPQEDPSRLSAHGFDEVEILFSANPGEALAPLRRVASGGELSRLMLAIKTALFRVDPVETYVFDEIDTGIGGPTADVLGELLAELGANRQVLCITHLPQIAAWGRQHHAVSKHVEEDRTVSRMRVLDDAARVDEMARMLGGVEETEATRVHAREMLERCHRATVELLEQRVG